MNRIERLVWEEGHLRMLRGSRRGSSGANGAKFILIPLLVAVVAALGGRMSNPALDEAVTQALAPSSLAYTSAALRKRQGELGPASAALPHAAADAAPKASARGGPPEAKQ